MYNNSNKLDFQKIAGDKKLLKELEQDEKIVLSAKLIKINHVGKQQQRVLLLTDRNLYNLLPWTFLGLFSRIKRKIPYCNIHSMTVSRYGGQFVIHVGVEHDYRFSAPNLKLKIVETLVSQWCRSHQMKMPLYYYDDLSLEAYTTTITDLQKKIKKKHTCDPLCLDDQSLKQQQHAKAESKLVFKNQSNSAVDIGGFQEFQLLKVLGRGAFGKVMLCQNKNNRQYYAVKSMRKQNLIQKQHLQKTKTQRFLLQKANHPFLVSLEYAFQTRQKLFFIMNFIRGGQMFNHLRKETRFTQSRAKFYAAQVYLALKYLHDLGYVYRDLKPENILFQTDGYIKMSDYGLAKHLKPNQKTFSLVGTPEYVSPEVILTKGQNFTTDWWAFGVLIYEMIYGQSAFYHSNHQKLFQNILNREPTFDDPKISASNEVKNLIASLLRKDSSQRLGAKSMQDIKNHAWFKDMDWQKLLKKQIKPDFIPSISNEVDVSNFDQYFTNQMPIDSIKQTDVLLLTKFEKQFVGLQFNKDKYEASRTTTITENFVGNFKKK